MCLRIKRTNELDLVRRFVRFVGNQLVSAQKKNSLGMGPDSRLPFGSSSPGDQWADPFCVVARNPRRPPCPGARGLPLLLIVHP